MGGHSTIANTGGIVPTETNADVMTSKKMFAFCFQKPPMYAMAAKNGEAAL
jgi:hypothetical protein